jgi:hypothetical protein
MKNRCDYWAALAIDMAKQCSVDATLDIEYVKRRVAAEGDTFFKVTLPQFAKDLESSLEAAIVDPSKFEGFTRRSRVVVVGSKGKKHRGGLPEFLGSFLQIAFDDTYTLTWDEYLECQNVSEKFDIPLSALLPPFLRPNQAEEVKSRMADAIHAVRQLCLVYAKTEEESSEAAIRAAVMGYKSCEKELIDPFSMGGSIL